MPDIARSPEEMHATAKHLDKGISPLLLSFFTLLFLPAALSPFSVFA
jgi:hypothetical protein